MGDGVGRKDFNITRNIYIYLSLSFPDCLSQDFVIIAVTDSSSFDGNTRREEEIGIKKNTYSRSRSYLFLGELLTFSPSYTILHLLLHTFGKFIFKDVNRPAST